MESWGHLVYTSKFTLHNVFSNGNNLVDFYDYIIAWFIGKYIRYKKVLFVENKSNSLNQLK